MTIGVTLTQGMRQNLFSLQQTDKLLGKTQERLSSGKRVNTALDDPVNFFKARDHYLKASDLIYRKTEMGEAIKTIEVANTGIEGMMDLLEQMKSLASSAKSVESTTEAASLAAQYDSIRLQVGELAEDADYGGTNLLDSGSTDVETLTVAFNPDGTNTLVVTGFDAFISGPTGSIAGAEVHEASFQNAGATNSDGITSAMTQVTAAITNLRSEAQELASALSTISIREDFTDKMANSLNSGGDALTLADMNEEGANMLMLQTRQALGTTSLSLSSQAAQSVLRLF